MSQAQEDEMTEDVDYGRWTYGDAGDRIPVRPRQTWAVGPHLLRCSDLEDDGLQWIQNQARPDVVYVDPPWNASNASTFRTKARVPRSVDYDQFASLLAQACSDALRSVFVESSRPGDRAGGNRALVRAFTKWGAILHETWDVTYYGKQPSALMRFSFGEYKPDDSRFDLTGMDDEHTPMAVLSEYPKGIRVLDPCTGRGLTPLAAAANGHRFFGTELHPRRMAQALDKLSELTGEPPKLISER